MTNPVPVPAPTRSEAHLAEAQSPLFGALVGLATLGVLLQAVWAGVFLEHDGKRDASQTWIDVHQQGANVTIVLALAATVVAFMQLRARRDLVVGSAVFLVLLIAETGIGTAISSSHKDVLTAVHVPLAMVIMAVAVWLPLRTRR